MLSVRVSRFMKHRLVTCAPLSLSRTFSNGVNITAEYKEKVVAGGISYDENQYSMLKLLQKVKNHLETRYKGDSSKFPKTDSKLGSEDGKDTIAIDNKRLRGVYLYGDVGTGKTMVMDTFYYACDIPLKKRVHFHDFMLEVHQRIHQHKKHLLANKERSVLSFWKKKDAVEPLETDSVIAVARDISKEAKVLCFDEFQVTDICDAMILYRLFNVLWNEGTVLVATSNRPPQDLYQNGLNRHYFLPFIKAIETECIVRDMNSAVDYRRLKTNMLQFNVPNNETTRNKIWNEFLADFNACKEQHGEGNTQDGVGNILPQPVTIPVMMGRSLNVPHGYLPPRSDTEKVDSEGVMPPPAMTHKGVAWADFQTLCASNKGAADYHALLEHFHTVYVYGVPRLSVLLHNEARRFITLIDELYNANIRLIWTSETEPLDLFEILSKEQLMKNKQSFGVDQSWHLTTGGERDGAIADKQIAAHDKLHPRHADQVRVNISVGGDATKEKDNMQALESELASLQDLSFAFKRAVSRLMEMVSEEYYAKWKEMYSVTRPPPSSQSPSSSSSPSANGGNGASAEVENSETK